jgi:hypothetical protein
LNNATIKPTVNATLILDVRQNDTRESGDYVTWLIVDDLYIEIPLVLIILAAMGLSICCSMKYRTIRKTILQYSSSSLTQIWAFS